MFCYNCGSAVPDGHKFCMNCGAPLAETPSTSIPQPIVTRRSVDNLGLVEEPVSYEPVAPVVTRRATANDMYYEPQPMMNTFSPANSSALPERECKKAEKDQAAIRAVKKTASSPFLLIIAIAALIGIFFEVLNVFILPSNSSFYRLVQMFSGSAANEFRELAFVLPFIEIIFNVRTIVLSVGMFLTVKAARSYENTMSTAGLIIMKIIMILTMVSGILGDVFLLIRVFINKSGLMGYGEFLTDELREPVVCVSIIVTYMVLHIIFYAKVLGSLGNVIDTARGNERTKVSGYIGVMCFLMAAINLYHFFFDYIYYAYLHLQRPSVQDLLIYFITMILAAISIVIYAFAGILVFKYNSAVENCDAEANRIEYAEKTFDQQCEESCAPACDVLEDAVPEVANTEAVAEVIQEVESVVVPEAEEIVVHEPEPDAVPEPEIVPEPVAEPKKKFCAICGNQCQIEDVFCQKCGNRLD